MEKGEERKGERGKGYNEGRPFVPHTPSGTWSTTYMVLSQVLDLSNIVSVVCEHLGCVAIQLHPFQEDIQTMG